jgi:hypothetical protein
MLEAITWPVSMALIGTLVVLATFLITFIKKNDSPWQKDLKTLEDKIELHIRSVEHRVTVSEGTLIDILRRIEEIKVEITNTGNHNDKNFDKTEEKLEKLTQLIIDILQKF